MTAADGLIRRGYPDPPSSLDDNDDLVEDCFIANIDPDVLDAVTEHESKTREIDRASYAVLNFICDADDDGSAEADKNTEPDTRTDLIDNGPSTVDIAAGYDVGRLQREWPDYVHLMAYLTDGALPDDDKLAKKLGLEAEQCALIDGVLYHLYHPRSKGLDKLSPVVRQLCVPRSLHATLFQNYHDQNCHYYYYYTGKD